jgi:hypothetical protein
MAALTNVARHARGCSTCGDDRIEARLYAIKRVLWRWGHKQHSGTYACSIAQLAVSFAPILGWDPPPAGGEDRRRWVNAKRKSIERWLTDLQAAGVLIFDGERDNRGQWWRTLITLRQAPDAPEPYMRTARRRARDLHETRRRDAIQTQIVALQQQTDQTHPFGALPPGETTKRSPEAPTDTDTPIAQRQTTPSAPRAGSLNGSLVDLLVRRGVAVRWRDKRSSEPNPSLSATRAASGT